MRFISSEEIRRYWEEHDVSMSEARRVLEDKAKDEYIEEMEDLVLLMYEGYVLGYLDGMEQEEQMKIIDDIVGRVRKLGIEAGGDDPDPVSE